MFNKNSIVKMLAVSFVLSIALPTALFAAGPATVNLLSAGNFAILAKTGISSTGITAIVGDIGVSPAEATYITGNFALDLPASSAFSTSVLVTGKVYAPSYAVPTPAYISTAVSNMETAYTDGAGRSLNAITELGAGNIGGMTLAPGLYKWGTGVTIPTDVTLSGSANDVWIFVIAQNLDISSATKIVLAGGANASNIFWVVAGQTTIGTGATFNGNILDQTAIVLNTGAVLNGRALAQSAVTLDASSVNIPSNAAIALTPAQNTNTPVSSSNQTLSITCSNLYWFNNTNKTCQSQSQFCGAYMYQGLQTYDNQQNCLSAVAAQQVVPSASTLTSQQQLQYNQFLSVGVSPSNALNAINKLTQTSVASMPSASAFGQQVKAIAVSLGQGGRGNNVTVLQQFLISQNKGSAAQALANVGATAYFGSMTRAALAEFQAKVGISPALGNFGPITRAYLSSHY